MNKSDVIKNVDIVKVFERAIGAQTQGILSHMSRGKWHMSKVILTYVSDSTVHVDILHKDKPLPLNINLNQPVGLTFKQNYSKFICESTVVGFEQSSNANCGGRLVLDLPTKLEKMQKRSFYRVQIPKDSEVKVTFWHRGFKENLVTVPNGESWEGNLLDLSAGGLQIGVNSNKKLNFKLGQLIGLQFKAFPHSKSLILEGQVRHIAKTADGNNICLGIQIVGLETSQEGREKLREIVKIVDEYQKILKKTETRFEKVMN